MSDKTEIIPARPLTSDDLDAIIATRKEIDRAFWRALAAVHRSGGVSANEIARRVGDAGIASRPTVLNRLRAADLADLTAGMAGLPETFRAVSQSITRLAAAFETFRDAAYGQAAKVKDTPTA